LINLFHLSFDVSTHPAGFAVTRRCLRFQARFIFYRATLC